MASLLNMSGGSLLEKGLPYDTEIEYLESTGTQYIDTGIFANGNIRMVAHINTKMSGGVYSAFSGVLTNNMTGVWQVIYPWNGVDFNVSQQEITFSASYTGEQTFDVDQLNKTITFNGEVKVMTNTPLSVREEAANIPLFAYWIQSRGYTGWYGLVYYVQLYNNNILVRDYIPVRVGNVGYMYDKVSGQLFGNAGTGNFILGNDI